MSVITWQALVTLRAPGVVDALQTVSCRAVTVAHSVRIYIEVTVAGLTRSCLGPVPALGVSKVSVTAQVTLMTCHTE